MGSAIYDWMYRVWAPWDAVGVRPELDALLDSGRVSPSSHPRVLDLGCGTGANVVRLAQRHYRPVGVDFSRVALRKARERADVAGVATTCHFIEGDLTARSIPNIEGPFDLLLDFGTLDDLKPEGASSGSGNHQAPVETGIDLPLLVLLRRSDGVAAV